MLRVVLEKRWFEEEKPYKRHPGKIQIFARLIPQIEILLECDMGGNLLHNVGLLTG